MNQVITFIQNSIERYPFSFFFLSIFFLSLFFLWWFLRRQSKRKLSLVLRKSEKELDSIPLSRLENPTPTDEQALEIVEKCREDIWYKTSTSSVMKSTEILSLAQNLVSDVARVYHPDVTDPMYEASLTDILELVGRVIDKIHIGFQELPLSLIAERQINEILKVKDYYQMVRDNPAFDVLIKNPVLFKTGKVLWSAYNTANPWYWGRKIAYKATKEAGLRYFYTLLISEAGEEAIRTYSGRNVRASKARQELAIASEMVNMAVVGGEVASAEYEEVLGYVLKSKKLDPRDKISLLRSLVAKKHTSHLNSEILDNENVRRLLIKKVEAVAGQDERFSDEKKKHLAELEKKLTVQSKQAEQHKNRQHVISHEEQRKLEIQVEQAILVYCIRAARCGEKLDKPKTRDWLYHFSQKCERQKEFTDIINEESVETSVSFTTDTNEFHKRMLLENLLSLSLQDLPITVKEEDFFLETASELDYFKPARDLHTKILMHKIPESRLINNPPFDILRLLFRTLEGNEEIIGLQLTSTRHNFREGERVRQGYYWVLSTSNRLVLLATARIMGRPYFYSHDYGISPTIRWTRGAVYDNFAIERGPTLENVIGNSGTLKQLFELSGELIVERKKNPPPTPPMIEAD